MDSAGGIDEAIVKSVKCERDGGEQDKMPYGRREIMPEASTRPDRGVAIVCRCEKQPMLEVHVRSCELLLLAGWVGVFSCVHASGVFLDLARPPHHAGPLQMAATCPAPLLV